jgi:hypothetical protein
VPFFSQGDSSRALALNSSYPLLPKTTTTAHHPAGDVVRQLDSVAGEAYADGSLKLAGRIQDVLIPFVGREFGAEEPIEERHLLPAAPIGPGL